MKRQIINHVCYRDVFNAPVFIDSLRGWMGIAPAENEAFDQAIQELTLEKVIVERRGFLAVAGNEENIEKQAEKSLLTKKLIGKSQRFLRLFSRLPIIKYIGISGSLAADNPTIGHAGVNKGAVDFDLFVISSKNALWILFLFERIFTNIHRLIMGHHFYCFNYMTDETFMEITNKNFYTATELVNLKTVYDDNVYDQFVSQNNWYKKYYSLSKITEVVKYKTKDSLLSILIGPINFICFTFFCIGRGIKRFELNPILEMFGGFNPKKRNNLRRVSNPNGGYQEAIKRRYKELYKVNFPQYYSDEVIESLFPVSSSFEFSKENVYDAEYAELFTKYALKVNEENTI
ncbi:MAG: hypothetical protein JXQ96_08135 [Cyclobacteriaceae bacterium]